MTTPLHMSPAEQQLQKAAAELELEGYTVELEPDPNDLPAQLRPRQVDLIARRGSELVIGEVASRSTAKEVGIDELARIVRSIPHADLRVFWLGDTEEPPRVRQVQDYVADARAVAEVSPRAGLLMALAAFEGAIAHYADRVGYKLQTPPRQMLEQLYSLGYIDEDDHARLSDLYKLRAGIAHNVTRVVPHRSDINYVLHTTSRMVRGHYTSEDVVTEWLSEK